LRLGALSSHLVILWATALHTLSCGFSGLRICTPADLYSWAAFTTKSPSLSPSPFQDFGRAEDPPFFGKRKRVRRSIPANQLFLGPRKTHASWCVAVAQLAHCALGTIATTLWTFPGNLGSSTLGTASNTPRTIFTTPGATRRTLGTNPITFGSEPPILPVAGKWRRSQGSLSCIRGLQHQLLGPVQ